MPTTDRTEPVGNGLLAAEQADAADEGRLEANGGMVTASRHGVAATMHQGTGMRPSQLIRSVGQTMR
jgi:hypothetical protein